MLRAFVLVGLSVLLLAGVASAVALTNGEHVACTTASATAPGYTVSDHVIADNGTPLGTITGSSSPGTSDTQTACVTATDQTVTTTNTGPTTTVVSTVTVTQQTTTAPTPAPAVNDKILFRYGDSYGAVQTAVGQGYDRYGIVIGGYGDDFKVAQLPTAKGLAYKMMAEVNPCATSDSCQTGVTSSEALAIGVLLRNASGALLTGNNGGTTYNLGDVGSTAYQNLWVQKVSARLSSQHLDGVFIDNVLCDFVDELSTNGSTPTYPTLASQRAAALSFVTNVGAQMRSQGFYVLTNTLCWPPSGAAASNDSWWADVAPNVSGLVTETFEQNPSGSNYSDLKYDCPSCSWMGDWKARLNALQIANAAGKDGYSLTTAADMATATGRAVAKYSRASELLVWDGVHGGHGVNTGGVDPWDATGWSYDIGTPTGAMTQSGAAYYRTFTKGKVIVNPSQSTTATVLGVTLAGKTAYIGS